MSLYACHNRSSKALSGGAIVPKPSSRRPVTHQRILNTLSSGPRHLSEISWALGLSGLQTLSHVITLRESGMVRLTGFGKYETSPGQTANDIRGDL